MGYHVLCQTPGFECKGEWIQSTMINSTFPFFHIQFYLIAKDVPIRLFFMNLFL